MGVSFGETYLQQGLILLHTANIQPSVMKMLIEHTRQHFDNRGLTHGLTEAIFYLGDFFERAAGA
jgi:hypothetical protein